MKYRMDIEYSDVKKPKPKTEPKYINDHKRSYGFHTKKELKFYRRGIEAVSSVYDFDIKVNEYEEKPTPKQLEFPFPEKTMQDPTPPEMDSYFGGHLGMKKEVIEDGIVAFTLDPKK